MLHPACPWDISWQSWQLSHLCWRSLCLLAGGTQGWGGFNPAVRAPAPRGFGASPQKLLQRERGHAGWTGAGISSSPIPRRLSGQGGSGQAPPCGPAREPLLFVIHRHIPRTQQPRTAPFPASSGTAASTPRESTRPHVAGTNPCPAGLAVTPSLGKGLERGAEPGSRLGLGRRSHGARRSSRKCPKHG